MENLPFSKPGVFYRGNVHTHSTRSDGARTPEQIVEDYSSRGYDFISLTDHFLPANRFRTGEEGFIGVTDIQRFDSDILVTIPGAELHGPAMENGEIWHIVANGLPLDFAPPQPGEGGLEIGKRAVDAGAFVTLAHPSWNAASESDAMQAAEFVHGIEIYNHECQMSVGRGYAIHQADVLLGHGHRLSLTATDDAHCKHPLGTFVDSFGGWVCVKAESLTADALVSALKAGAFYASQGPDFHHVEIVGDTIRIACSPVEYIVVSGRGASYQEFHGASLIGAEALVPDSGGTPYLRITIADAHGRRAWTNPIWLA